jgi:hypothetical protein
MGFDLPYSKKNGLGYATYLTSQKSAGYLNVGKYG